MLQKIKRLIPLVLVLAGGVPVGAAPLPDRARDEWPAERLVLFGARWCAPCMAELADLGPLADAARPQVLVLAWIDRPVRSTVMAKGGEIMPAVQAQNLASHVAGLGFGLPLGVMTDAAGHPCAMRKARLHPMDVAAMRAQCARGVL